MAFIRKLCSSTISLLLLIVIVYLVYTSSIFSLITQDIEEKTNGSIIASNPDIKQSNMIVIELFTSQGCSSCPPAEAILRDLSQREDVLTLEFHVDYWNNTVHGLSGRWKDPFSSPQATMRQSDYNKSILNSHRIYTPQVIIDGVFEMIGSNTYKINKAIKKAKNKRNNSLIITSEINADRELTVTLSNTDFSGEPNLLFVRFFKRKETIVKSGENKGKKLADYNIVNHWSAFHDWNKESLIAKKQIPPLLENESCAVLLQDRKTHQIYAAGLCRNISKP